MKFIRLGGVACLALALALGSAFPASAQYRSSITQTDIQRLQDGIYDAQREIAQLGSRDGSSAAQLQAELDDARDEAIYLKVKLRRNEPIATVDYSEVRDRVENIRNRARGDGISGYGAYSPPPARPEPDWRSPSETVRSRNPNELPVGTEFDVRLQSALSSRTSLPEDTFDVTTMVDLQDERGHVLVPAGATMRGTVTSVTKATRFERTGGLTVAFDRLTFNHRSYPIRATVTQAIESEGIRGEAERIGIGAGAGAILGAILGGAKGALAGILIGGGGTIMATEGNDVDLPAGTVLRVRFDTPLMLYR